MQRSTMRALLITLSGALALAVAIVIALWVYGLSARMLSAFAPDVALVTAAALVLLCLPAALRAGIWARRAFVGTRQRPP